MVVAYLDDTIGIAFFQRFPSRGGMVQMVAFRKIPQRLHYSKVILY